MKPSDCADSGVDDDQPEEREDPRERVAEQQQQEDARDDLEHARRNANPTSRPTTDITQRQRFVAMSARSAREHRRARHRQRAETVDQALLEVLGEPDRGDEPAEGRWSGR